MIFTAQPDTIERLWDHALPHIERFTSETMLASPEDIRRDVIAGSKQLWLVEQSGHVVAVAITTIYGTMRGPICCIWAAAGTIGLAGIAEVMPDIEAWAIQVGCVAMEVRGRKGWAKVLDGFEPTGVLLEKNLGSVH